MRQKRFSKGEAIIFGWETTKNHLWFFIVISIIFVSIPLLCNSIISVIINGVTTLIIFTIIYTIICTVLQMGIIRICLKFVDGMTAGFGDLFACVPLLFKFLLSSILYMVIIMVGSILLIIPGIIWSIAFVFWSYFVVDKKLGPIEALEGSLNITKGAKWDIFLFLLLLLGINILGALTLVIGLLVTIPITSVAFAYVYHQLSLKQGQGEIEDKIEYQKDSITIAHEGEIPTPVSFLK